MDILGFTLLCLAGIDDCRTHGDKVRITSFGREYRWTANTVDGRMFIMVEPVVAPYGMASVMLGGSDLHAFGENASAAV